MEPKPWQCPLCGREGSAYVIHASYERYVCRAGHSCEIKVNQDARRA